MPPGESGSDMANWQHAGETQRGAVSSTSPTFTDTNVHMLASKYTGMFKNVLIMQHGPFQNNISSLVKITMRNTSNMWSKKLSVCLQNTGGEVTSNQIRKLTYTYPIIAAFLLMRTV